MDAEMSFIQATEAAQFFSSGQVMKRWKVQLMREANGVFPLKELISLRRKQESVQK